MTPEILRADLEQVWSAETSAGDWTRERPSSGQCAVTALVVHKLWGGEILRVEVPGDSHYWNRLPDGTELDLTRDQFDEWAPTSDVEERTPECLLSHEHTRGRFELLWQRLGARWWG